jgi:hypothetical protein
MATGATINNLTSAPGGGIAINDFVPGSSDKRPMVAVAYGSGEPFLVGLWFLLALRGLFWL